MFFFIYVFFFIYMIWGMCSIRMEIYRWMAHPELFNAESDAVPECDNSSVATKTWKNFSH